jgi:hypothetical protein
MSSGVAAALAPLRVKYADNVAHPATVTFDEATALDSSHLLIALVGATSSAHPTASGWTSIAAGGATARRATIFARQGNGAANGITFAGVTGSATVTLLAFSGFSSLTPIATGTSAGHNAAIYPLVFSSNPAGNGVAVAVAESGAAGAISAWSNGYTALNTYAAGVRGATAYRKYDGTNADTTVTLTGNAAGGWAIAALPLV